jgi:hypothetical protein
MFRTKERERKREDVQVGVGIKGRKEEHQRHYSENIQETHLTGTAQFPSSASRLKQDNKQITTVASNSARLSLDKHDFGGRFEACRRRHAKIAS